MTKGEEFIFAICEKGDLETLVRVREAWLFEPREAKMYRFAMDYFVAEGELPPVVEVSKKFGLKVVNKLATPSYYLKELKRRYAYSVSANRLPSIVKALKSDPIAAVEDVRSMVADIDAENEQKGERYEAGAINRRREYTVRKSTGGISYMKIGVPAWDTAVLGYEATDLWTIAGRSGLGKTWLLCYLAVCLQEVLYDMGSDRDILIISNEMSVMQLSVRLDSIIANVDYEELKRGSLTAKDEKSYFSYLNRIQSSGTKIRIEQVSTVAEIDALASIYNPSAIFVDGAYLLEPESKKDSWQRIQYITTRLKALALRRGSPIIQTTQLGRGSGKKKSGHFLDAQDEFSYGLSFIQDSDYAIRMFQDADMVYYNEIGLEFAKFRHLAVKDKFLWTHLGKGNYEIKTETVTPASPMAYGSSSK
jgi:hypothetical protein